MAKTTRLQQSAPPGAEAEGMPKLLGLETVEPIHNVADSNLARHTLRSVVAIATSSP
jgi:hypothetical protein